MLNLAQAPALPHPGLLRGPRAGLHHRQRRQRRRRHLHLLAGRRALGLPSALDADPHCHPAWSSRRRCARAWAPSRARASRTSSARSSACARPSSSWPRWWWPTSPTSSPSSRASPAPSSCSAISRYISVPLAGRGGLAAGRQGQLPQRREGLSAGVPGLRHLHLLRRASRTRLEGGGDRQRDAVVDARSRLHHHAHRHGWDLDRALDAVLSAGGRRREGHQRRGVLEVAHRGRSSAASSWS